MKYYRIFLMFVVLLAGIALAVIPEADAQTRSTERLDFFIPLYQPGDIRNIDEHSEHAFNIAVINLDGIPYSFTLDPQPQHQTPDHMPPPDGAMITPQGGFSWTPAEDQVGTHTITIVATDDHQMADVHRIIIRVLDS